MSDAPAPVEQTILDDLHRRLVATRRPVLPAGLGWDRGTDENYLAELVAYWAESYDWRPHEARILGWPWVRTSADSFDLRSIHQRATDENGTAVVLLHGWPDSVLRFEKVLPLLTDLNVVVPCLPGYPFAEPLTEPGMSTARMADVIASAMAELGYDRYVVSGGDVGSGVAERLAAFYPEHVSALHLTDVPHSHLFSIDSAELSDEERDYLDRGQRWQRAEGAYAQEQATKPHTLAAGLADSPAGLAAWIVEKLRSWSDSGGDVESVFPREDLLTWVTAYWVTGTIGTSFSPYVERSKPVKGVQIPTAVTIFPRDLVIAPRSFAQRFFDVQSWDEQPDGGHFAAWERPAAFVDGVRTAVALQ
ncbi:MAG: epoxide hydrolase [Frankiales bacterium]|nr:epoxide hydrolase [Frankiales bacterium]